MPILEKQNRSMLLGVGIGAGAMLAIHRISRNIEIDITAPDSETLEEATDAVVVAVSDAEGIGQVSSNLSASLPYIAAASFTDASLPLLCKSNTCRNRNESILSAHQSHCPLPLTWKKQSESMIAIPPAYMRALWRYE